MAARKYFSELDRARARPDAANLCRQLKAYEDYQSTDAFDWPEEFADDFGEILDSHWQDVEKALAYVVLGAAQSDDASFVSGLGCGTLEDLLDRPSDAFIQRIVTEARRSPRFRWMLSCPFKVAVSNEAWTAIEPFRITGPHEEPPHDTMPEKYFG